MPATITILPFICRQRAFCVLMSPLPLLSLNLWSMGN